MTEIHLEKCCRTCLRDKRPNQMKLLSTKWNSSLSFADMLIDLIKVPKEITSDECSLRICSTCEQDLITAYNFKIVCHDTEKRLSDHLIQMGVMLPIEDIKFECYVEENVHESLVVCEITENLTNDTLAQTLVPAKKQKIVAKRKPKKQTTNKSKTSVNKKIMKTELTLGEAQAVDSKIADEKIDGTTNEPVDKVGENKKKPARNRLSVPKKKRDRSNQKPSVYCQQCDIKFESNREYVRHRKDRHWTQYPCQLCGKLFFESAIEKHMQCHSDEKNYACNQCDSKFHLEYSLRLHMRIHSGEKRYKCNFCDEHFIHWNSKKNHMYKMHTHEKK